MTALGFPVAGNYLTDTEAYIINVGAADANDFAATATYQIGDDEAGKCLTFTIDGRGAKGSAPLADCWTRAR